MNHLRPDCLFVELCPQRIPILYSDEDLGAEITPDNNDAGVVDNTNEEPISFKESMKNLQESGMSRAGALSTVLLTKVQGDYADKLGVKVGQEFKVTIIF